MWDLTYQQVNKIACCSFTNTDKGHKTGSKTKDHLLFTVRIAVSLNCCLSSLSPSSLTWMWWEPGVASRCGGLCYSSQEALMLCKWLPLNLTLQREISLSLLSWNINKPTAGKHLSFSPSAPALLSLCVVS